MNNKSLGKKSILLSSADVKQIIAERFNVSPDNVFKSQYSYTVKIESDEAGEIQKQ